MILDEVATLWGANRRTVANYINDGKLSGVKPDGRTWRIRREVALAHVGVKLEKDSE